MSRQATLIVGGYGGVGAALADALAEQEPKTLLLRSRRAQSAVTANSEGAEHALALDLRDTRQYADFAAAVKARLAAADATLTRLLIASGILQTAAQRPERGLRELDAAAFHELVALCDARRRGLLDKEASVQFAELMRRVTRQAEDGTLGRPAEM